MSLTVNTGIYVDWVLQLSDDRAVKVTGKVLSYHIIENTIDHSFQSLLSNGETILNKRPTTTYTQVDVILGMSRIYQPSLNYDLSLCLSLDDNVVIVPTRVEGFAVRLDKLIITFVNFGIYETEEEAKIGIMTKALQEA